MNQPFLHLPSGITLLPPHKILPPSCLASSIYDKIFSICCLETIAPRSVEGSNGSPTLSALTLLTKSVLNLSYIFFSIKILEPHRQISPWFWNEERTVVSIIES